MKITAIQVQNFLGVRAVDVKLTQPVTIFAGKNFAGKSSLQEAIRMALTGDTVRVSLKKDYGQLVSDGATTGFAEVELDSGDRAFVTLPKGDTAPAADYTAPAALPFVLDAQRFARLAQNDRRSFLFSLMGLSAGGKAVMERLLARGCDEKLVGAVMPLLRAGFDAAHKEAQAKARDAKAAWRAITGETYGEKKGEVWAAQVPAQLPAWDGLPVEDLDRVISELTGEVATLQERSRAHADQAEQLAATKTKAGMIGRITAKLNVDKAARDEWLATVTETRGKASCKRVDTCSCPECGVVLTMRDGQLETHVPTTTADPEAAEKLPEYERALALLESAVKNGERDLAEAQAAAEMLKSMKAAEAVDPEHLRAKRAALELNQANRRAALAKTETHQAAERARAQAASTTEKAAQHHAEVAAWAKIADALAPDGIMEELLAEALMPINLRLIDSAATAEWGAACISNDMSILGCNGRPYAMLSESEQWRVDAMIAEAIAHLSGVKLLVLDRFDVLDLKGREDLIAWLDILAQDGEIDTALIFGTMKALPSGLPATVRAHWIESGVVGQFKAAA